MKNCIRIPRICLPEQGFRKWAVIACDQFTSDRNYWERVAREVGGAPSSLCMILPEVYLGEEDEERIAEIHENMYRVLEEGIVHKLDRGFVLTERRLSGGVRRGILAAIDLEEYSYENSKDALICATEAVIPERLPPRVAVRRGAVLEFPHAMVFYRDKKDKVLRGLLDEELEKLYDFDLMLGGGHLTGYFVPEDLAVSTAHALMKCADPCFAVADGNHSIAAAKAYWEEVKTGLSEKERSSHPARFTLVEFVNIFDEAVCLYPIHRLVKETDADAFCDWFSREIPCERKGKLLYPALPSGAETIARVDVAVASYLRSNGGKADYIHSQEELESAARAEDCAVVVMKSIGKEDVFAVLKGGRRFPRKSFSVGDAVQKRYYLEGREISYD